MRAIRSPENRVVIAALALLGLTSAAAVVRGFANGDFDEGLAGWQARISRKATGAALAAAECEIEDFYQGEPMARMDVHVRTGAVEPRLGPGPLAASMEPRRSAAISLAGLAQDLADIPGTTLTFEWISSITGELAGAGRLSYHARLVVERVTPPVRHEFELLDGTPGRSLPCGTGMVFDGRPISQNFYADLGEAGIHPGDDIRVTVELEAQAGAVRNCDLASFSGTLWVDRFALRRTPLTVRQGGSLATSKP
jgi:hypothetical protein